MEKGTRQGSPRLAGPLGSERGSTTVSNTVVSKVAGAAAHEVGGIQIDEASTTNATRSGERFLRSADSAIVDLFVAVEYGTPIPRASEAVRRGVINRVEGLVGIGVKEVNIVIYDVEVTG